MKRKSMVINILIGVSVLIVILVAIIATRPAEFSVTRSTVIAAPPAIVFAQVNDLHNWDAWSPWAKLDPEMRQSYEGAAAGVGAVYSWSGNSKVGEGRMTITDSAAAETIRIKLEFLKPFAAVNTTVFSFEPKDGQTVVQWSMSGTNNFMAKAFGLFVNMDKMVGGDFEKGLAQLKTIAESAPQM